MSKSWTIGSKPDCDLVVTLPRVSGHHCRLTRDENGYLLEDLGSTNGTYLNGVRITDGVRVTPSDSITFGLTTPMPWPPEAAEGGNNVMPGAQELPRIDPTPIPTLSLQGTELVIGRASTCSHVLDLPMISSRHARLFRSDDRILIEDLGSSNGTFVNAQRVNGEAVVKAGDLISLGTYTFLLSVESRDEVVEEIPAVVDAGPPPPAPSRPEGTPEPWWTDLPQEFAGALKPGWRLVLRLGEAPFAAILIVLAWKANTSGPKTPEGSTVISQAVVTALFWLGLAAVWFVLSNAVLGKMIDATPLREGLTPRRAGVLVSRLFVMVVLCICQSALAWVIVSNVAGLKGPGVSMLALLVLTSFVGLALGMLIVAVAPRPMLARVMFALVVVAIALLGGGPWPLSRMPPLARAAALTVPSRWAFEGLLLLETGRAPMPVAQDGSEPVTVHDLAENAFPAASERMGVRADVMALALMAIGLTAAAGFIAHERGRERER
jgi:pSer/pThr/pTyr-binding forkhead associated (FHA) protein